MDYPGWIVGGNQHKFQKDSVAVISDDQKSIFTAILELDQS